MLCGLLAGGLSALLTLAVYAAEDLFQKHMPIHWMWWPAIGGLAVGLGGFVFPQALGVGYETIGALLQGSVAYHVIWGILLVKSFIWAFSLGSGTSGGVLAPLLMMGGALGGLEAMFLPNEGAGFWPVHRARSEHLPRAGGQDFGAGQHYSGRPTRRSRSVYLGSERSDSSSTSDLSPTITSERSS